MSEVICEICGRIIQSKDAIRHHVDPSRKTKEPSALGKKDVNEKKSLIYLCRSCHAKTHSILQKSVYVFDDNGKKVLRKEYRNDNPLGAIWK